MYLYIYIYIYIYGSACSCLVHDFGTVRHGFREHRVLDGPASGEKGPKGRN